MREILVGVGGGAGERHRNHLRGDDFIRLPAKPLSLP